MLQTILLEEIPAAGRRILRRPWFAIAAAGALAAGIGVNVAVFSAANAVLMRGLPYRDAGSLVWIWAARTDRDRAFFSLPDYLDFQAQNTTLASFEALSQWAANRLEAPSPRRLQGMRVTHGFFDALGVTALHGRYFRPGDTGVVVLSFGLWTREYGVDPGVVGRAIKLNNRAFQVIGVARPDLLFPAGEAEIFTVLDPATEALRGQRGQNYLRAIGRLKPGVTIARAQADLAGIEKRLRDLYPADNAKKIAPRFIPLHDEITGPYSTALRALLAAAALVLLLTCANLGNLLMTRAAARVNEQAIRMALGATALRASAGPVLEALLIAAAGGTAGIGVAWMLLRVVTELAPRGVPRMQWVALDGASIAFGVAATVVTAVLCAMWPAFSGAHVGAGSRVTRASGGALIGVEVALCVTIGANALLLVESMRALPGPGFVAEGLVQTRVNVPSGVGVQRFVDEISAKLSPGAKLASTNVIPLSGLNARRDFTISGRPAATAASIPGAQNRWVSPLYHESLGIPILRGRPFAESDNSTAQRVAIVDEALARQFWPGEDPLGAAIMMLGERVVIVGLCGGVKHFALEEDPLGTLYMPVAQVFDADAGIVASGLSVVSHSRPDELRDAIRSARSDVAIGAVTPVEQLVGDAIATRKFLLEFAVAFAIAALLLAVSGVFAVAAYDVRQRRREIGIRAALGGFGWRLAAAAAAMPLRSVAIGAVVGLVAAMAAARAAASLFYGVSADDSRYVAVAAGAVCAAAVAAIAIPARRAAGIDPAVAMRTE
jgi:predicted permease